MGDILEWWDILKWWDILEWWEIFWNDGTFWNDETFWNDGRYSGMMRHSGMMRNKRKINARGWWSVCFSLFYCRLYGRDGRESENILNKVGYLLETRAKNKKSEKKALWSVGDEGKNQENWEKSPVVSWRWGWKTRKVKKKPCGQLMMRAKNDKSE